MPPQWIYNKYLLNMMGTHVKNKTGSIISNFCAIDAICTPWILDNAPGPNFGHLLMEKRSCSSPTLHSIPKATTTSWAKVEKQPVHPKTIEQGPCCIELCMFGKLLRLSVWKSVTTVVSRGGARDKQGEGEPREGCSPFPCLQCSCS